MAKLIGKAVVDLRDCTVTFNGEKFPYYISQDGIDVTGLGDRSTIPLISFSVPAETVEVIPKEAPTP